ncbi:hypothetical protein [Kitasatospora mediocidica]|uniref:hypothetical protein n=1 Tax=Kitasatospora mediocidica TaxID=58352 RepID=UPI000561F486|nr:hypothetical protein [Kitasatospora mediocidica]
MTTPADDFTELRDADIPRVDLVDKAANGTTFLIAKRADGEGLMDPGFVRDLIGKAAPEPTREETVTMTGSPSALMKLIHEATVRREAAPIAKADHSASQDEEVTKMVGGELDDGVDGMDPTVVLAAPESDDAPGDPNEPGSPAWEAVDAATAQKWTSIAVRLKNALGVLADREMLEAATADPDDADNAWDLQDAQAALDYVIDILAGFAVDEQAEAELCTEAMEQVGKALGGFDTAPLDTFEALAPVAKAGRSLSAANEQAIRDAVSSLQKVLASLPAAPIEKDSGPLAANAAREEPTMTEPTTAADTIEAAGAAPAMGAQKPMAKADADKPEMVAVYDQNGNLVGVVDPTDITVIQGAGSNKASDDGTSEAGDADTSDDADATQTTDLEPQPADQAGTPADAAPDNGDDDTVTKKTTDENNTFSDMFKSSLLAAVEDVMTKHSASQTAEIAKTGDAVIELAELVETLKGRIGTLEEQPAEPKIFTQGAGPTPQNLRGQDRDAPAIDVTKAQELKKSLMASTDAVEQRNIAALMNQQARLAFDQLQQRS